MNCNSFSARSFAKVYLYSLSFSLRMVVGVEVSRYMDNRIMPFSTRSLRPVVTGEASLIPLLVSRVRSRKALFRLSPIFISREPSLSLSIKSLR